MASIIRASRRTGKWLWEDFNMNSLPSHFFYHSEWEHSEELTLPYLIYRIIFMVITVSSVMFSTICESHMAYLFFTNWSFYIQVLYGLLYSFYLIRRWYSLRRNRDLKPKPCRNLNPKCLDPSKKPVEQSPPKDVNPSTQPHPQSEKITVISLPPPSSDSKIVNSSQAVNINQSDGGGGDGDQNFKNVSLPVCLHQGPNGIEIVIWILMNIMQTVHYMVAMVFWLMVFHDTHYVLACAAFRGYYLTHSGTVLFALVDTFAVAIPVRLTHSIFPALFYMMFTVYSYIYEIAGGMYLIGEDGVEKEYIYPILNWRRYPGRTLALVVAGMLVISLFHTIFCWLICRLRMRIGSWFKSRRNDPSGNENNNTHVPNENVVTENPNV